LNQKGFNGSSLTLSAVSQQIFYTAIVDLDPPILLPEIKTVKNETSYNTY
jgi:hypothetical protein